MVGNSNLLEDSDGSCHRADFIGPIGKGDRAIGVTAGQIAHRLSDTDNRIGNTDDDHDHSANGKDERNDAGNKKHALSRRGLFCGRLFGAAVIKLIDLVHRDCNLVGDLKHFSLDNRLGRFFTGAPRAPVISQDVTWT
jgi:hypothetical protein